MTDFSDVFWIGGGTGGGKSTIAIALAERHGLERYEYDWHDSRGHSARTLPDRHPARAAFLGMSMDERWVLRTPETMARATLIEFTERFEMVLEDLAALDAPRVMAEGFGLLPELVKPVLADPRHAVFLLPTPDARRRNYARRGWVGIEGTSDHARAGLNKLDRDALLTDHVRRTATALDLAIVEIDGSEPLEDVITSVERRLGLAEAR